MLTSRCSRYSAEPEQWGKLLIPIVSRFSVSFYLLKSQETKDFWLRACHSAKRDDSGDVESLSGWLTAFCFWDKYGKRICGMNLKDSGFPYSTPYSDRKPLTLDDNEYPMISPGKIPISTLDVPVYVDDYITGLEHQTTMVAGLVGMSATTVGMTQTSVQPHCGW
ncbi:uncharacterized protein PAC_19325 [Phialocephala subalpina]|uniref:Uncharacterized protein n=1 Tax=Phialocephala subalpina TaxID=576137 RepID=A0A1L7XWS6_9HELO|nr:uncharacterized protein PAC_19325 [Phialocephala subalpina]